MSSFSLVLFVDPEVSLQKDWTLSVWVGCPCAARGCGQLDLWFQGKEEVP